MKALVVDDEAEYRRILVILLKRRGIDVLEAGDGLKAWELFQENRISFVLSDWMMPGLDGVELIQYIRQANQPYYTYFIMLTAVSAREDLLNMTMPTRK